MRSNRDEPRGRARFACVRVAEESGGPPQPPSVVVRLSPHADAHTARPVATGRSGAPTRSPSSIASARWLEASTVRDDVRAYRRARGWVASAPHASSGVRTAAASESYCACKPSRAHVPRVDVGVATHHRRAHGAACVPAARVAARTVGKDAASALWAGPGTGCAGARPATTRRCTHPPKQRSDCATARPPGPPASGAPAHRPGTGCAPARRAISRPRTHLRDQMGPGAGRRGVSGDLAGARRRPAGSRPLAAVLLVAAAGVARRHAARRRRARDARTPARRCRLATLRSRPPQLVRTTIPSTCARARRSTPRCCTPLHLRDQMGPGAGRRGVSGDLAGARRRPAGSRPLAAVLLVAAAGVARRHAARRRRARDARTPARRCRLATLRSRPPQLVRTTVPSTRNLYSGSVYSTIPNGDRCLI